MGAFILFSIIFIVSYFWLGLIGGSILTLIAAISCWRFCANERKRSRSRN